MADGSDNVADWILIHMYCEGDDEALRILHDGHRQSLLGFIKHLLREKGLRIDLAEDIFQDVWVALSKKKHKRLGDYNPERSSFNTHFGSLAREQILHRCHAEGYRNEHQVSLEGHEPLDPGADEALTQAELAEYKESLTSQQRRCLDENLVGNPKQAAEPPISGDNERQLKHRMEQKWDEHFESR